MQTCPNCRTGILHPRTVNYANWHGGQYVIVPNLPAWSCDVCALCRVDPEALQRLLPLIGPVTRPDPTQPGRTTKPLSMNEPTYDDTDPEQKRRSA